MTSRFVRVGFLPIVPLGGSLHIPDDDVGFLRRPFPMHTRSVVAAYLRVYPLVACAAAFAVGWNNRPWLRAPDGGLATVMAALALTAIGWLLGFGIPRKHQRAIDALLQGSTPTDD